MNRERAMELAAVRYAIIHELIGSLDMGQWASECGTAGCLIGNLPAIVPSAGVYVDPIDLDIWVTNGPDPRESMPWRDLAVYFGISTMDVRVVFDPMFYPEHCEDFEQHALEKVEMLLRQYCPDVLQISERELSQEMGIDLFDRILAKESGEPKESWHYEPRQGSNFAQLSSEYGGLDRRVRRGGSQ